MCTAGGASRTVHMVTSVTRLKRGDIAGLTAWEPGYALMLAALTEGKGHSPEAADKQGQKALGASGCAYADAHLIPALQQVAARPRQASL